MILDRVRQTMQLLSDIMEILIAIIVGVSLVIATIRFMPEIGGYIEAGAGPEKFMLFLEEIFNLVVGIEFIKMMCKPSSDNIIEVLMFLVARHMILGGSTALDNFFSILGIAVLYIIKNFLHEKKNARAIAREQIRMRLRDIGLEVEDPHINKDIK